ncbi:MAG: glycine--tRNA ligase subunit beta [Bryobacterales bacterium]|nr:glycine--tRNA ligase subunit beta [Bryobacterales bacterium]
MSLPFLLEIGTEEIPDWMIPGALEQLGASFRALLETSGLAAGTGLRVDATPRRLVLRAENLPPRQADTGELVTGPPKAAPAKALEGFARKQGVRVEDLSLQQTPKGEYYGYRRTVAGRGTLDILSQALPGLILGIHFPKTMYWTGQNGPRFIRPIRWLVALLGDEVVPFTIAGIESGRITSGHRRLGSPRIEVSAADFERKLAENFVILSADARRARIEQGIAQLAVTPAPDPDLLAKLVHLTEYPTPIAGEFSPEYLSLPEEVLITVMRRHQNYFSVRDAGGRLAPRFIAVMNTSADPGGLVRQGNERVLRARFNDARFFWQTDRRKTLEERLPGLAHVTFQARLGSYLEKTERMVALVRELGGDEYAVEAARLSKCDLTTELVKEFTELQGVVGGLYARAEGKPEQVWQAIYDHYQPAAMEDPIPRNLQGRLVSLADKLDTLRGCFSIGLIPTGSRDPFALRRAAQGVIKILVEGRLPVPLKPFLQGNSELESFLEDRIWYYFKEIRGFRYDEVNAVLAAGWSGLPGLEDRLQAVRSVRPTENFEPLAASFKRIRNILRQAQFEGGEAVQPGLLEPGPESDLYAACEQVRREAAGKDYLPALEAIASLRPKVDLFFDKVLVNAPDERIRRNRLALLHTLLAEFSSIADFSEIVTNH